MRLYSCDVCLPPDICPAELRKVAKVLDELEKRGIGENALLPLFITLDPNRDSVEAVRQYTRNFHPRLRGATGKILKLI